MKKKKTLFILFISIIFSCLIFIGSNNSYAEKSDTTYSLINKQITISDYNTNVVVFDPENKQVSLLNGKFIVTKAGDYNIVYSLNKTVTVKVYAQAPALNFVFDYDLEQEYGIGKILTLPKAFINSSVKSYSSYKIEILNGTNILSTINATNTSINKYELTAKGAYTLKYKVKDVFELETVHTLNFNCTDKEELNYNDVPDFLEYNKEYDFGQPYITKNGININAAIKITNPDSTFTTLSSTKFTPAQCGIYFVSIKGTIQDNTLEYNKSFTVGLSASELFTREKGITSIKSNVDFPAYAKQTGNGVEVRANSSGAVVRYNNIIDLNKLSATDDIIRFQALSGNGLSDIKEMDIKLIDANDPLNFVNVKFTAHEMFNFNAYVKVNYPGIVPLGLGSPDYGNEGYLYDWYNGGAIFSDASFMGSQRPAASVSDFNFQFDLAEKQIWIKARYMQNLDIIRSHLVLDLDDQSKVGINKDWKGFTTNEVLLSISFTKLSGISGIIISEIAAQSLAGETVEDTVSPSIGLDRNEIFKLDNVPYGIVGKAYRIPLVKAQDFFSGSCPVTAQVFKKSSTDTEQPINNGFFTPTVAGNYYLKFTTKDAYGNLSQLIVDFAVYTNALNIVYSGEPTQDYYLIDSVYNIPKVTISGVSGNSIVVKKLFYNNEQISLDNENITAIYLRETGSIKYVIEWTDYLYNVYKKVYDTPVIMSEKHVKVTGVPLMAEAGQVITLPDFVAINGTKQSGESGYYLAKRIEVVSSSGTTVLGTDRRFNAPATPQMITVNYFIDNELTPSVQKQIKIIDPVYGLGTITNYIIYDLTKVNAVATSDSLIFNTSENNQNIMLPYPIVADNMMLRFGTTSKNNFGYFDIILEDNIYENLKMFIRVYNTADSSSNTVKIKINGTGSEYLINRDVNGTSRLVFDNRYKRIKTENGIVICNILTYSNGTMFMGFSEGIAKLSFSMCEVLGESELSIQQVSNQVFNRTVTSANNNGGQGPVIRYDKEMSNKRISINSSIIVSKANAYDVFYSGETTVKVTVTDPNGVKIINNVNSTLDIIITAGTYGYYTITYTARNIYAPIFTQEFKINVIDEIPPTIEINGVIKSEYKLNEILKLPSLTAFDNHSAIATYIFVVSDYYRHYYTPESNVTFDKVGTYQIIYLVYDSSYNSSRIVYDINVTK